MRRITLERRLVLTIVGTTWEGFDGCKEVSYRVQVCEKLAKVIPALVRTHGGDFQNARADGGYVTVTRGRPHWGGTIARRTKYLNTNND